ncbi:ribosome maturation factor RimM [Crenobacter sp. SG2303]|uniref:Ribosome maturation factor RimM n=1 Tax=Crenobacter oryzisoli TaxID=3056844 RepID=A0ABT7XRX1_9NEIS|nr:ribosome maturation factor RimM [Crenobacter sp. SG2303]MDN0076542.1 ribosome maturation factor RimM [Crenobacter sp. SG2303]
MRDADLVIMGYVSGAHGVRGWVKIHADTEYSDSLFDYPTWWLGKDGNWKPYTFVEGVVQPKAIAAKLEGVEDRDVAFAMRGLSIAVPRSELPETGADEYYWTDLIGLAVVNRAGESLGTIANLMETGANDVLVVKDGTQQRLIPFVGHVVLEVNLKQKQVLVDWELDY